MSHPQPDEQLAPYHLSRCDINSAYAPNTPPELLGTKKCDCGLLALIRSDREQAVKTREHDLDHYYSKKLEQVDREQIVRHVTDICFDNGGVTYTMAEKLADYMEEQITAAVREARIDEVKSAKEAWDWENENFTVADAEQYLDARIAQLKGAEQAQE